MPRRTRQRKKWQKIAAGLTFLVFSIVLIINNATQLFQTFNIPLTQLTISVIAIAAMFGSCIWAIILASMGEFD